MARFCLFTSFIFSEIYFAGCALIGGAAGFPKKREHSERFFWDGKRRRLVFDKHTPKCQTVIFSHFVGYKLLQKQVNVVDTLYSQGVVLHSQVKKLLSLVPE